jgi:hypothetical protein
MLSVPFVENLTKSTYFYRPMINVHGATNMQVL